jgi:hypothetical protein
VRIEEGTVKDSEGKFVREGHLQTEEQKGKVGLEQ